MLCILSVIVISLATQQCHLYLSILNDLPTICKNRIPMTSLISPSQYPLMHVPEGPEGELLLNPLFFGEEERKIKIE